MTDSPTNTGFDSVEDAIAAIADGRMVIVTDDESRENEGDLVLAAEKATPENVNVMIRHAGGLSCVPTTAAHLRHLGIGQMVQENRESHRTAFSVSVDAAEGITTGISAYDRARTINLLASADTRPDELVQPGHIFPLRARPGGVLERAGHTEAAVDLVSLAALRPVGAICEILNDDGTVARLAQLAEFKKRHGLLMISISQLIHYRHTREPLVEKVLSRPFPSDFGDFELHVFRSKLNGRHHLAFTKGELGPEPTLVRVHGENLLSDIFRAKDSGSHHALVASLRMVAETGEGVVLYMQHADLTREQLFEIVASPESPPGSRPPMSFREYGLGAQILVALGLRKIRLMSGTMRRVVGLDGYGLEIVEQVPLRRP
jgi:3,4-dihydroxy 2-butanone 4-phosphate synthase/GTP cyclohydrolase II